MDVCRNVDSGTKQELELLAEIMLDTLAPGVTNEALPNTSTED